MVEDLKTISFKMMTCFGVFAVPDFTLAFYFINKIKTVPSIHIQGKELEKTLIPFYLNHISVTFKVTLIL